MFTPSPITISNASIEARASRKMFHFGGAAVEKFAGDACIVAELFRSWGDPEVADEFPKGANFWSVKLMAPSGASMITSVALGSGHTWKAGYDYEPRAKVPTPGAILAMLFADVYALTSYEGPIEWGEEVGLDSLKAITTWEKLKRTRTDLYRLLGREGFAEGMRAFRLDEEIDLPEDHPDDEIERLRGIIADLTASVDD